MMNLLVRGARIISPKNKINKEEDILIEKGIIKKISKGIKDSKAKVIDAKGKIVVPGLIDMHTHLREPGGEDKETILSGARAAVKGGFSIIACMANTNPPLDSEQDMDFILTEAKKTGLIDVLPIGAITLEMKQQQLTEIAKLKKAGAVALSEDGYTIMDSSLFRRALEYTDMYDLPVICHSEDDYLAKGGQMNEGYMSTLLGLKGIPNEAESIIVARDINLARITGSKIHIAHVSTKESVDIIRQAKKEKIKVTAETCPHYLLLTDEDLKDYDTHFKVNPPLRSKKDQQALKEALADGTIDMISSDHAPHLESEKDLEFDKAPFGMTGLETSLAASYSLVEEKTLSLDELVYKMSTKAAEIFNLQAGLIKEGLAADLTIINPSAKWQVKKDDFESKSSNSAFLNREFNARPEALIFRGRLLMDNFKIT
jgi:dihydroorotase